MSHRHFNAKSPSERADDQLQIRVRKADKRTWKAKAKTAGSKSLAAWVIQKLNQ